MPDEKTSGSPTSPEPRSPQADPYAEEGPGLFDILGVWWRQRVRIILLALAGGVAVAAVFLVVYLVRPSHQESTLTVRLLFNGVENGQYPNGMRFTPADIVATPVLEEVYRRNELAPYLLFSDFKDAFAVTSTNPALERLRREYQDRLAARNLTSVDREKLEDEYESKVRALQSSEFTIVALLGERFSTWPAGLTGKVMNDILTVWADQSRARGVFKFDLNIFSDNILADLSPGMDDYLVLLDRLRVTINRVLGNLKDLAEIPGAGLVRVGERRVSLGELQVALQDDMKYRLSTIEAPIFAMGFYRNRVLAEAYIKEQLFRLEVESRATRSRAESVQNALVGYSASRTGAGRGENMGGTGGGGAQMASGGTLIPQISESFLDRVLDLSTQKEDIEFRQDLSRQTIEISRQLADLETEREIYDKMLKALNQSESSMGADRQEVEGWVEQQVTALIASLKNALGYVRLLHEEISQRSLQPSTVYTVVAPASQQRVSVVGMRSIGIAVCLAYAAYLGTAMVILAWRGLPGR